LRLLRLVCYSYLRGTGCGAHVYAASSANLNDIGIDRETVDAFHKAALLAGGKCNGPPGLRPEYHESYYGAFVLDPLGNNVEMVSMFFHISDIHDTKQYELG
jgi:predicted lactoylglutathione lyase